MYMLALKRNLGSGQCFKGVPGPLLTQKKFNVRLSLPLLRSRTSMKRCSLLAAAGLKDPMVNRSLPRISSLETPAR